ncbi:semaphorin-1A [Caerostris extrusa]|uniref:Semaphorin-1A n=1 Tax=Caerostris extrusa TaxID=172846 RepID=A0AAV4X834_CAEEX|nr:semaphorin-1A [Caerostris extrusa]
MDRSVPSFWNHPVVLQTIHQHRLTMITVDPQIETSDEKRYDVLYVGTDNGKVLKCINAGSNSASGTVIPVVIEEFQVFQQLSITNLMVYHTPQDAKLVVVSKDEIKTIPLFNCDQYAKTCGECVALPGPILCLGQTLKGVHPQRSLFKWWHYSPNGLLTTLRAAMTQRETVPRPRSSTTETEDNSVKVNSLSSCPVAYSIVQV